MVSGNSFESSSARMVRLETLKVLCRRSLGTPKIKFRIGSVRNKSGKDGHVQWLPRLDTLASLHRHRACAPRAHSEAAVGLAAGGGAVVAATERVKD